MLFAVLLALQGGGGDRRDPPPGATPQSTYADVFARLPEAVESFVWVWRNYWEASAALRMPVSGGALTPMNPAANPPLLSMYGRPLLPPPLPSVDETVSRSLRWTFMHCHPEWRRGGGALSGPSAAHVIAAGVNNWAVCPAWIQTRDVDGPDESRDVDAWIAPALLSGLRASRAAVLDQLDRAATAYPTDGWIAGQRVHLAVDQGDAISALAAARSCRADPWWCAALAGYARYIRGEVPIADSLFAVSVARMPADVRCVWTDLSPLLDVVGRDAYGRLACAQRDSLNARIWWLADPLYSEHGNERRAEHYARQVMYRLRADVSQNERWALRPEEGGDAVREMLLRYGWPAYSFWAGRAEDRSHFGYLDVNRERLRAASLFASAEYPFSRIHTMPSWETVGDPWRAEPPAWALTAPPATGRAGVDSAWWPPEHFARHAGPVVGLESQTEMLPRQSGVRLAVATDLPADRMGGRTGDSVSGVAFTTWAADSMRLMPLRATLGGTVVAWSTIDPHPQIVGVEYATRGAPSRLAARTRAGVMPPQTLSSMRPGEIRLSTPALVRVAPGDEQPVDADSALANMFGSTRLPQPGRVGIFWETYGLAAGDTAVVSVAVRAAGVRQSPSLFRRLAALIGMGGDDRAHDVTVTWTEPMGRRVKLTHDGAVPIQSRTLAVDFSGLAEGDYTLTVTVARPGVGAASAYSQRAFSIGGR